MIDLGIMLAYGKWRLVPEIAFKNPERLARFVVKFGTTQTGDFKLPVDNDLALFVHDNCPEDFRYLLPFRAKQLAKERHLVMDAFRNIIAIACNRMHDSNNKL